MEQIKVWAYPASRRPLASRGSGFNPTTGLITKLNTSTDAPSLALGRMDGPSSTWLDGSSARTQLLERVAIKPEAEDAESYGYFFKSPCFDDDTSSIMDFLFSPLEDAGACRKFSLTEEARSTVADALS